jgi:SAM-dependent methyltransferase
MPAESLDDCLRLARARLYPSISSPNYLVLRRRREIFLRWIANLPGTDWQVLDVGGRYQPYRPLLEGKTKSYIAIDIQQTPLVSVVAQGEQLPFATETFDLIIATQVFDCFQSPMIAATEVHRVLKPGGCLFMSVPSFAPRFADVERWRFLPAGLKTLLGAFSSVEIVAEVRSIGTLFRTLNLYFSMSARSGWLQAALHHSVVPTLNLIGWQLEKMIPLRNDQFTANYSVLATK